MGLGLGVRHGLAVGTLRIPRLKGGRKVASSSMAAWYAKGCSKSMQISGLGCRWLQQG